MNQSGNLWKVWITHMINSIADRIINHKFATKLTHRMAQQRETRTNQRHADIYSEFLRACAELSPSNKHFTLNMKQIYSDIAERFHYSPEHVYKVVNKMMKQQGHPKD
jgi:translation initiation factor 2 beta subunit (eIF-2beta)/eIF-5